MRHSVNNYNNSSLRPNNCKLVEAVEPGIVQWSIDDQGQFHHQKGLVLEGGDQIEAAKAAFTVAIDLFEQQGMANTYWVQSLIDRSYMDYLLTNDIEVYCPDRRTAVAVARATENPEALAGSLIQLAFCHQKGAASFETGLNILKEAATIAQENELAASLTAMIHNATGNLYRKQSTAQQSL